MEFSRIDTCTAFDLFCAMEEKNQFEESGDCSEWWVQFKILLLFKYKILSRNCRR